MAGFDENRIDTKLRCVKHRTYMALRKPTADCQPCREMYADAESNRRTHGRQVHPEIAALIEKAHNQGIDPNFIKQIVAASESDEDTIMDLEAITEERKPVPKLKPLPHREHELEPHEEAIFEETLAGEHQPQRTV